MQGGCQGFDSPRLHKPGARRYRGGMPDDDAPTWTFVAAPAGTAPGVVSMVGYRALASPPEIHRGLPSPTLTFIVSLDEGLRAANSRDALGVGQPVPVLLSGLQDSVAHVRQQRGQAGVQLAVHPLAARALFGAPSAELNIPDFDGSALLGRRAAELHERVAATPAWDQSFATIATFLREGLDRRGGGSVRPEVRHAWHLLGRTWGRMPANAVADRVGLTPRHLTTLFQREVGRSPKAVALLMRFHRARSLLADAARRGPLELSTTAVDAGYSDQAHLTREFTRFAGTPPRRWLAEEFRNIQDGGHRISSDCDHDCLESKCLADAASS